MLQRGPLTPLATRPPGVLLPQLRSLPQPRHPTAPTLHSCDVSNRPSTPKTSSPLAAFSLKLVQELRVLAQIPLDNRSRWYRLPFPWSDNFRRPCFFPGCRPGFDPRLPEYPAGGRRELLDSVSWNRVAR